MLIAIFFVVLCFDSLGRFIKYAVSYFVSLWDENRIRLKSLRKGFGEFQSELQNLSAKDEFAKYARVQRKVNKTKSEISNIVAERKQRVAKFLYPLKILIYILNVSSTIALLVMYRNILCGDIPVPWLSPFDSIISFPLSNPGKISVPVWIFMCRIVSGMVMKCFGT